MSEITDNRRKQLLEKITAMLNSYGAMSQGDSGEDLMAQMSIYHAELQAQHDELQAVQGKLEQSRRTLTQIFEAAPIGYLVIMRDGEVIQANTAARSLMQLGAGGLVGSKISGHILEADRLDFDTCLSHCFRTGHAAGRFRLYLPEGLKLVEATMHRTFLTDFSANVCLVMLVDVTEQDQVERQLRQARDQAEAANIAKSEFLANMNHELRTPLASILGYAELLIDESIEQSEREEYLQVIMRNGRHLLGLIEDILDMSSIDVQSARIRIQNCNLARVITDVLETVLPRVREKGLSIGIEACGQYPPEIRTDPNRLRQIIMNLVVNAVKFTDTGRIVIQPHVAIADGQMQLTVKVCDTGLGIGSEVVDQLFEPFAQADGSLCRRFGGLGLGLSISHKLAERMGGQLTLEHADDSGSTFCLELSVGPVEECDWQPWDQLMGLSQPSMRLPIRQIFKDRSV